MDSLRATEARPTDPASLDAPSRQAASPAARASSFAASLARLVNTPQAPTRWQSLRYLVGAPRVDLPAFLLARPAGPASDPLKAAALLPPTAPAMTVPSAARAQPVVAPTRVVAAARSQPTAAAPTLNQAASLDLSDFPQPVNNNGRGIHWVPTTRQTPEVVDRLVAEAQRMGIRWVTFLNQGTTIGENDYLVKRLREAGIMPILRVYTDAGSPIEGDLASMVRHYRALGVPYFQLFNEPNLRIENGGRDPDVADYLDRWLPAARVVIANGGLPGLGALSPQGDVDDLTFLRETLRQLRQRGTDDVLGRTWLSVHNYGADYLRVREYDRIVRAELGRSLPQIGTEAGIYPGPQLSQQEQTRIVVDAYEYMKRREPYYLAYTYWIIANGLGGGHDPAWEHQALFRADGSVHPLVDVLRSNAALA